MTPDQKYNASVLRFGPPDAEIVRADGSTTTKAQYQEGDAYMKIDRRSGCIEAKGVKFDDRGNVIGPEGVRIIHVNAETDLPSAHGHAIYYNNLPPNTPLSKPARHWSDYLLIALVVIGAMTVAYGIGAGIVTLIAELARVVAIGPEGV